MRIKRIDDLRQDYFCGKPIDETSWLGVGHQTDVSRPGWPDEWEIRVLTSDEATVAESPVKTRITDDTTATVLSIARLVVRPGETLETLRRRIIKVCEAFTGGKVTF